MYTADNLVNIGLIDSVWVCWLLVWCTQHMIVIEGLVVVFVVSMIVGIMQVYRLEYRIGLLFISNSGIEMVWTIIPLFIVVCLVLDCISVFFGLEEVRFGTQLFRVLAAQWYWIYSFVSGFQSDSNYVDSTKFMEGVIGDGLRQLHVTLELVLLAGIQYKGVVTSMDVIHALCIPSLGVKVDAIPGRLSQFFILSYCTGIFVGQCSELCGTMHAYMPLVISII